MQHGTIKLASIRIDGGTQPRSRIDESVVSEYAEAMREGATFPPVVVFHDGVENWLADGFHRVHAARHAGQTAVAAEVKAGTKRDAILYSVSANATHGARRTNEDKRKAVMTLLSDAKWVKWSNVDIAKQCVVSDHFVGTVRSSLRLNRSEESTRKYTNKHGTVSTMHTENIGKRDTGKVDVRGRKIVLPEGKQSVEDRATQIAELASQGYRASQIAQKTGVGEQYVRNIANANGIELPDHAIGKARRIDSRRVIEQTVLGLEASAQSLNTITFSFDGISKEDARDWEQSVSESLAIYRRFHKDLKEAANG